MTNPPPPERRKDHRAFRQLLDRTSAQVGLLDAIEQGYQEFTAEIRSLLNRALIAMTAIGLVAIAALGLSAWQMHKVGTLAADNRTSIAQECRDVEALKTAIRATLLAFVPRDARSQHRFAPHPCPHDP